MGYAHDPINVAVIGDDIHVTVAVRPDVATAVLVVGPNGAERLDAVAGRDGLADFDFAYQGHGHYLFDIWQGDNLEHDVAETTADL